MRRLLQVWLLTAFLWTSALFPVTPARAAPARQGTTVPTATATPPAERLAARPPVKTADVKAILDRMSAADKVGQLFLVTFEGSDVSAASDIAVLVRDFGVGGVVLRPANGNFRSAPTAQSPITATSGITVTDATTLTIPLQIAQLSNALQMLALSPPRPITIAGSAPFAPATPAIANGVTVTTGLDPRSAIIAGPTAQPLTPTATVTLTQPPATPARPQPAVVVATITATLPLTGTRIPLLIGLEWDGDDSSFLASTTGADRGFSPLAGAMAIGATWTPAFAETAGQTLGKELRAVGINLLLGPPLDVLDTPRPGSKGDLDTRTFGGDPFWVGQMGQAFIRGVQLGSQGQVQTAAKHFPGQGSSDRRPEDEVATVQKSVQQLRQIELAPFAAVTTAGPGVTGTTAALTTSHIRYRGFQGNIRQLTPPISLAPQLQDLMALKEFADWRTAGGVLISDALGVPAVRRYYDPQLQKFPHRQVAQDAFLAGNDLLYLSRFALTDDWRSQLAAIKETILYFQNKYQDDTEFRARVDASVTRILQMKLRALRGGSNWKPADLLVSGAPLETASGNAERTPVTQAIARASLTLIYPSREDLADRMPSAPLADENILIFTEARPQSWAPRQECPACEPIPAIAPTALEEIMLRLYGPTATGQLAPSRIRSLTFTDLARRINPSPAPGAEQEIERAIVEARWIIFAMLDYNPEEYPDSAALRNFLAKRSDSLRDKRLVVMAFRAPYYLDTTEISKLTAYFGIYSKTPPFLETAVRALFREFSPIGALPVSVAGVNYDLIKQLEPAAGQIIPLNPTGPALDASGNRASIQVGNRLPVETGVILDRNGHPVPDGTPVEFRLRYPTEGLELAPKVETTSGGKARTTVVLDRAGELWITVQAGEAKESTRIVLKVGGDAPGSIATVLPSPTAVPTLTPTPAPTPTPTPVPTVEPTAVATPAPAAPPPQPRAPLPAFLFGLLGVIGSSGIAFVLGQRRALVAQRSGRINPPERLTLAVGGALWAVTVAWAAYLLYALGLLWTPRPPGATQLQAAGMTWVAGVVSLAGGLLSLTWSGRQKGRPERHE
jgi:beta-N-acetylhexosaminidase